MLSPLDVPTLPGLLARVLAQRPEEPALLRIFEGGTEAMTWKQVGAAAARFAAVLSQFGVRTGERVFHVSENRWEWVVLDLAIHQLGAVHVAAHATLTGEQLLAQIDDCRPTLIVVSDDQQGAKLAACERVVRTSEIVRAAEAVSLADEAVERGWHEACVRTTPETLATLLYTSGTTGEPKGVMLSHGNLASNAMACAAAFGDEEGRLRLCWLPLSHIYARTSDFYTWLASGGQMALARSRETLLADLALVRPTFMNGVPYFYDKLMRHLVESGRATEPGALAALLGGNLRSCCAGGAPLTEEVARFFERQGVLLVQGYGLTEASPVITTGTRAFHRIGTVGPALPGVEVRIADDGEVLTRGPHVMQGYWNNPQATAETIRDGWLHTGDLGELDAEGYLRITGRKKELLVLSSGKNISPAAIEGLLGGDPLIAQSMVVGDGRSYLCALIVPSPDALRGEVLRRGIAVGSAAEALAHPQVLELYRERIASRLVSLSPQEQVKKFSLVGRAFSAEHDELTPTLKLRRGQIAANFAREIDAMYGASAPLARRG